MKYIIKVIKYIIKLIINVIKWIKNNSETIKKIVEPLYYIFAIIGIVVAAFSYRQSVRATNQEYKPAFEVLINQKSSEDDFIIFCSDNLNSNNSVPTLKFMLTNKGKGLAKNIKMSMSKSVITKYLNGLGSEEKNRYNEYINDDFEITIQNYLSESEAVTVDVPDDILKIFYDIYCLKAKQADYIYENYKKITDSSLDIPIKIECVDNQEREIKYDKILKISFDPVESTVVNAGPNKQKTLSVKYGLYIKE